MSRESQTSDGRVAVVIATRNRLPSLLTSLAQLGALPELPSIVVVDNGSSDGTADAVRERYPQVEVVALPQNLGAAARTVGMRRTDTPYVAFSDDDSWWAPRALARAADLLDAYPRLAVVAAKVLLGPESRPDPTCLAMAASPLADRDPLPGPPVLGFIACGAVVRRSAYLAASGFHPRFGIGGEEELLAADLAADGWKLAYADDVVAYHHPSSVRDRDGRRRIVTRNALWFAWLRRPLARAIIQTMRVARAAVADRPIRSGLIEAVRGLPWVLKERRSAPQWLEAAFRCLDHGRPT